MNIQRHKIILLSIVFTLICMVNLHSQDVRDRLFKDADATLAEAKRTRAELYSPSFFEDGFDSYMDAENMLREGDDLEDIKIKINDAVFNLRKANEIAVKFAQEYEYLVNAREDAIKVDSDENDPENWIKAESLLRSAAEELEDEDKSDADEDAFDGEKAYRSAELNSIKKKYLNQTWELIDHAKDENVNREAPKTIADSEMLIKEAETELIQNRYDTDRARDLAMKAYYQANHAKFISKTIREINDGIITVEDLILISEEPLVTIGQLFDFVPHFDSGYATPSFQIQELIKNLQKENSDNEAEIDNLNSRIKEYENELGGITEEKSQLRERLAKIEDYRKRVDEVSNSFSNSEAIVIVDEEKITIRLISLTFDSGQSVIQPRYFSLLTKIQDAIKKFPNAVISVEGHTDAYGKDKANLQLSQQRAQAVFQYLFANLDLERDKIFAIGYGESRPIANNESDEGRRKNRRIDIVIRPEKAY